MLDRLEEELKVGPALFLQPIRQPGVQATLRLLRKPRKRGLADEVVRKPEPDIALDHRAARDQLGRGRLQPRTWPVLEFRCGHPRKRSARYHQEREQRSSVCAHRPQPGVEELSSVALGVAPLCERRQPKR